MKCAGLKAVSYPDAESRLKVVPFNLALIPIYFILWVMAVKFKNDMTIKELKEKIKELPDDMKIGGFGHFGEFLECWDAEVRTVSQKRFSDEKEVIFSISIEDAGDEPD